MIPPGRADPRLERYLEEGLLAFVPCYHGERRALVLTLKGAHPEPRSVTRLVELSAACYNLDIVALRRRSAYLLGLRHHLALALTGQLVLLPVTVRKIKTPGETTQAFINREQVEALLPAPPAAGGAAALVRFKNSFELPTLHTQALLKQRLDQGLVVQNDCLNRRERGSSFAGLESKALLAQLPGCSCFLKDFFLTFFRLEAEDPAGAPIGPGSPGAGPGRGAYPA